ncbi:MAG: U32 family peptidase [Elusimicrobiota bacterium]
MTDSKYLSVATNFQQDFTAKIAGYSSVKEVYGKLPADFTGGGRPSFMVPPATRKILAEQISQLHSSSIRFNYLLNSTCLDNAESTTPGYRKIRKLLDWLSEIKVDSITVSIPYLAEIIKKHYPYFSLKVSAFAGVSNLRQAQFWQDLGADTITLEPQTMNREFQKLSTISQNTDIPLQLIVNQGCLFSCPNVRYHSNLFSHASQEQHRLKGFVIDYCSLKCKLLKLSDKVNFIRSDWIRPEDLKEYIGIGINHFKIIQRNWKTDKLLLAVNAYQEGMYNGNLSDLTEFLFGKNEFISPFRKFLYFFRPSKINLFHLLKIYDNIKNLNASIEVDNQCLDGFIDIFKKESCFDKSCEECRHCHKYARSAVKISGDNDLKRIQANLEWIIDREHPPGP